MGITRRALISWKSSVFAVVLLLVASLLASDAWAQVTASLTGTLKDTSGAVVPGVTVTIKNLESGLTRTAETDASGSYNAPSLPVGQYEVSAEKPGFKQQVRRGITLAVAQQAVVNLTLEVGEVEQQVTVTAAAPLVNTTLSPTSGLVGEKQVKDLPLNGRSFDQLLTLTTGTTNYTTNSSRAAFSVSGRRPEESRFLLNGVDYVGANAPGQPVGPTGASGQLLGVDAVREFNVVAHTYGTEYGKVAGGQVSIVTTSGTNQLHGTAFEYLRNSKLDARNFFDQPIGLRIPPFKRNQFGGALGGPLKRDKLFLFGTYEGFRQRLGVSDVAVVPDDQARQGRLPDASGVYAPVPNLKTGMLPFAQHFWPAPNAAVLGGGLALNISNPPQKVREDFGLVRFDYNASAKDSLSANYLKDDGENDLPQPNPNFIAITPQSNELIGLQETHIFSPTVLNTATLGFTRAFINSGTIPAAPIPANLSFIADRSPGTISIGGGIRGSGTSASITNAPGNAATRNVRNLFSGSDDVRLIRGRQSLSAGFWYQRIQQNMNGTTGGRSGNLSYPSLTAFLQDLPTQLFANVLQTPLGYRSTEAAWYVQDEIKLKPNLTMRLGLRDEMTNGYNEVTGRCGNYAFGSNGVMLSDPLVGPSCLKQNNAKALWQPRVGVAWDPTGTGAWAVRAGVGIYNDLQDTLAWRLNLDPPYSGRVTFTDPVLSLIPLSPATGLLPNCSAQLQAAKQPCAIYGPGGVEPNMHTPTVQQWSFTVEREITKDLMLQVGYVGSQAYHLPLVIDRNTIPSQVCSNPAGCSSGGILTAAQKTTLTSSPIVIVPQGTTFIPPGLRPNPFLANTVSMMFAGNSSYHALNVSLVKRASRGLTFKANYTFSKALDMNSLIGNSNGTNQPQDILNPYDLRKDKGIAAFDLQHQFNANFSYELPFGHGQRWGGGASGFADKLMGGWQWNGIVTAQSGFPFTPQVGTNISGSGDASSLDVPNWNPAFSGPVILGKVSQWYDPHAFLLPTAGTIGNVSRGALTAPGVTTVDTSLFKAFRLNERWSLQFRAEAFNLFNHANFKSPNASVFSGSNISPSAGIITGTATTSRQIQFALKLQF
jgi:carboxypeptidase family protein